MDIRLYNTLRHEREPFRPIDPPRVRMYHCGPTVYDYAHIGNFRAFLLADLLRRFFEFAGYDVTQVMNITDVGHMTEDQLADGGGVDKMQLAAERLSTAKKQGTAEVADPTDPYQVAQFFTEAFLADEHPHHMPHATENIDRMIAMIQSLIERGHAYTTDDAVYYDVTSFPEYGKLSGNTLDQLATGAGGRIDEANQQGKRNPADFLLWKVAPSHLMKWDSPWGVGYPGWHIECSAMAMGTLGVNTLDIHTGGEDNIFPHHECEIAQATGTTGEPFANHWLHTRHLLVEGAKMSKSRGNFHTVRELLSKGVDPAVLRYELMRTHYRANANFTSKGLADSEKAVRRLRAFDDLVTGLEDAWPDPPVRRGDHPIEKRFAAALADDLNISEALGALFGWINNTPAPTPEDVLALRRIDGVLGVLRPIEPPEAAATEGPSDADIEAKVERMRQARAEKDYATSDAIRDELQSRGVEVQITRDDVAWRRIMQL